MYTCYGTDNNANKIALADDFISYYEPVYEAYKSNFNIYFNVTGILNPRTSAADNCAYYYNTTTRCSHVSDSQCLLAWNSNVGQNSTISSGVSKHCKSINLIRNENYPGLPAKTFRVAYTGHSVCDYSSSTHTNVPNSIAMSHYDLPIVGNRFLKNKTLKINYLVLAHEMTHCFNVFHCASSICVMKSGNASSGNISGIVWCNDCKNTITQNKNRYN